MTAALTPVLTARWDEPDSFTLSGHREYRARLGLNDWFIAKPVSAMARNTHGRPVSTMATKPTAVAANEARIPVPSLAPGRSMQGQCRQRAVPDRKAVTGPGCGPDRYACGPLASS